MGKIVSSTFVSLDGVINHMDRWHFDFIDAESDAIALQQLKDSQGLLMGRRTYEIYAQAWPGRDGEYADRINATAKYVASTTLQNPAWTNTTVLEGDLVEAVTKLKQDPDKTCSRTGTGRSPGPCSVTACWTSSSCGCIPCSPVSARPET